MEKSCVDKLCAICAITILISEDKLTLKIWVVSKILCISVE